MDPEVRKMFNAVGVAAEEIIAEQAALQERIDTTQRLLVAMFERLNKIDRQLDFGVDLSKTELEFLLGKKCKCSGGCNDQLAG